MKSIVIIADSRGARLAQELRSIHNNNVHYRVLVKSGARLIQLWELAENEILFNRPDLIFILGSICDLTDRHFDEEGNRYFWPPANLSARVDYVIATMEEMANNAQLIGNNTKVCFLQENGMDINKYNGISDPIPWRNLNIQHNLERGFSRIQTKARQLNASMGLSTPRSLDITHSRRNGRLRPVYNRLYDGLHFQRAVARQLARILDDYVIRFFVEPSYEAHPRN